MFRHVAVACVCVCALISLVWLWLVAPVCSNLKCSSYPVLRMKTFAISRRVVVVLCYVKMSTDM